MEVIGFTNKYYTLWEVSKKTVRDEYEEVTTYTYTYIKNISYDMNEAIKQYPNATIDLNLKGSHTFVRNETRSLILPDCFQFGKYRAQPLMDCKDIEYIRWYVKQIDPESEHFKYVREKMEDEGFIYEDGMFLTKEEKERNLAEIRRFNEFRKLMNKHENPVILFERNLFYEDDVDCFCYKFFIGMSAVYISFEETKEMEYNGFVYGLPVKKKTGKKIKNKNLMLTGYKVMEDNDKMIHIKVSDFEILK